MGLFNSLKGKVNVGTDDHASQEEYTPPRGPPPSRPHRTERDDGFAPPTGPPPSQQHMRRDEDGHTAPAGPPPLHGGQVSGANTDHFGPPSGPPPSYPPAESKNDNPPPYHDWTVIPDTSLLPPPPPLPQDYSPTNNATYDSAARAHEWCARHVPFTPARPSHEIHLLANAGYLTLEAPPSPLNKHLRTLRQLSPTTWAVRTDTVQQDAILLSSIPVYFACVDNPLLTERAKTIYFEIKVIKIENDHSGIAIGFAAKPYPPWRLPGWHRASIGVHGDDGRRFVNDSWGGRDFVGAFRAGESIGVGMKFEAAESGDDARGGAGAGLGKVKTRAFVTRDGKADARWSWEIDEERDERDEGVEGLMGEGDLYPAIGVFGGVIFEVQFGEGVEWKGDV